QKKAWHTIKTMVNLPVISPFKKRYSWVQLAGHTGSFKAADSGKILKRFSENEKECFERLMKDPLRSCVPCFHGVVERDGESYIQLDDLLTDFEGPCVMDCKMGIRWDHDLNPEPFKGSLQRNLSKTTQVKIGSTILWSSQTCPPASHVTVTPNEKCCKWLTSCTYKSSLCVFVQKADGTCNTNFKTTKTQEQVLQVFVEFIEGNTTILV
ncbi:IP3KA kinase, partial [Pygoscelis papua]